MSSPLFWNRQEAGSILSEKLQQYKRKKDTLILALVRGGVEIGRAVADALDIPLHPYVVRKIGHPHQREFAVGAIAEGGGTYLDESTMERYGLSWDDIESTIEEETREMRRRKQAYALTPRPPLQDKTVILTDDGAATGATLFAAIRDMREAKVREVIAAIPVCPPDTATRLAMKADRVVIVAIPEAFSAVGQWYLSFPQLEDTDVLKLLEQPGKG